MRYRIIGLRMGEVGKVYNSHRDGESVNRSPAVPGSSGCFYGCFGNRFRPRPLSRGGGLAGCQQARAVSAQGGRRPAEDRVAAP
ncbi:hypothetical protein NDU88_002781 [Pleurodeles waltl]|uniref:Uncharacterized protein n=1 Tax=Pleurodeles waltl TaxID=8319 RepID=A0AAV7WQI0_PLEWA|nr:hypothetical protein NDU88_002781 [Pleurodeles waltl]